MTAQTGLLRLDETHLVHKETHCFPNTENTKKNVVFLFKPFLVIMSGPMFNVYYKNKKDTINHEFNLKLTGLA
jgi:hypothetical protein